MGSRVAAAVGAAEGARGGGGLRAALLPGEEEAKDDDEDGDEKEDRAETHGWNSLRGAVAEGLDHVAVLLNPAGDALARGAVGAACRSRKPRVPDALREFRQGMRELRRGVREGRRWWRGAAAVRETSAEGRRGGRHLVRGIATACGESAQGGWGVRRRGRECPQRPRDGGRGALPSPRSLGGVREGVRGVRGGVRRVPCSRRGGWRTGGACCQVSAPAS